MDMALSRDDWAAAGLAALVDGGLAAVAVEPLAKRLGATKGSFYWHFTNRDALLAAVLERWEAETEDLIAKVEALPDPRARRVALSREAYTSAAVDDATPSLLAVASDPRIEPTLRRVVARQLGFLEDLHRDLGRDPHEARRRARFDYALFLGIGQLRRIDPGSALSEADIAMHVDPDGRDDRPPDPDDRPDRVT